eukprot:767956-Hanusia_phi.AAC.2
MEPTTLMVPRNSDENPTPTSTYRSALAARALTERGFRAVEVKPCTDSSCQSIFQNVCCRSHLPVEGVAFSRKMKRVG